MNEVFTHLLFYMLKMGKLEKVSFYGADYGDMQVEIDNKKYALTLSCIDDTVQDADGNN